MGFASNAQDYRPKQQAAQGNAPMIGNKQQRSKAVGGQMVYVSSLLFQVNEQELMDFFKSQGFDPIRSRLLYDQEGNSKGSGFVELSSMAEAEEAVSKLNGEYFQGRQLNVSVATSKKKE
jgi:RNA recognition motif-containing protein